MTKIITPPQPEPILAVARELLPPGMELIVVDPAKPEFYDKAVDADYYLGSPRAGIGNEFSVVVRERPQQAEQVKLPFYRRPRPAEESTS